MVIQAVSSAGCNQCSAVLLSGPNVHTVFSIPGGGVRKTSSELSVNRDGNAVLVGSEVSSKCSSITSISIFSYLRNGSLGSSFVMRI